MVNINHSEFPDDIICDCSGTTTKKIMQLIDSGKKTLEDISRATGACAGCGACETDVMQLIQDYSAPES